jgi:hypothetical protein
METQTLRRQSALNALERRLDELELLASTQSRELRIQFERIAQLQAEYDILRIRSAKSPRVLHGHGPRAVRAAD